MGVGEPSLGARQHKGKQSPQKLPAFSSLELHQALMFRTVDAMVLDPATAAGAHSTAVAEAHHPQLSGFDARHLEGGEGDTGRRVLAQLIVDSVLGYLGGAGAG